MSLPWNISLPILRASGSCIVEMEYVPLKLAKSKRQRTMATSTPEAEILPFVYVVGSHGGRNMHFPVGEVASNQTSVDGKGGPRECYAERNLAQCHQEEHEVRNEKEKIARDKPYAWCDFCGKHAVRRQCCEGCKMRGVKTYYCDLQCQTAAWHMPPRHRCARRACV